jgi:signal transduction histidine kinase
MFKSIFKKLLVTYLIIIIAVISILSFILSILYSQYVFDEKNRSLDNAAFHVTQLAKNLDEKRITNNEFDNALDSMGTITDSKIYLVRLDKQALASPETLNIGEKLEESFLIHDLGKVLDGSTVFRQKQYSKKFDMYVVFAGVPWRTDNGIEGAILLFSPVSHISSSIVKMNMVIWLTALFFILISTLAIYINSTRISKPIREMEQAALKLANGENAEDLVVKSGDEIGKLAATFNFMKQQLTNTEKMRREFIANVSHDLRTPLTSINGFVEGMLDGVVKPADYKKSLLIIKEEANRLTRLTGEILQLAKIQSGSLKLNKELLNVQSIINSVIVSTSILLKEKSFQLSVDCDASFSVCADKDKLKQILINIVSNAVKYSKEGGIISIKVAESQSVIRFVVKDTGVGIPKDELPFIFEKFYRVDKSRQASQGGTGLGLNIVKSLVELHGGKVWISSDVGIGTEIFFELPKTFTNCLQFKVF